DTGTFSGGIAVRCVHPMMNAFAPRGKRRPCATTMPAPGPHVSVSRPSHFHNGCKPSRTKTPAKAGSAGIGQGRSRAKRMQAILWPYRCGQAATVRCYPRCYQWRRRRGSPPQSARDPCQTMKCSIVIRAYNEGKHIRKLLLGISQQSLQPREIILVDSGSTDDTVAIAREFGVRIVAIEKRLFTFGRALNIGCAAASGEILVFVSAHVYPRHADWLASLVAPFADPKVVLSYGKQRGNELNHYSEHQIFAKWFPSQSVSNQRSYFCNNANCAVRRSQWELRPYDE